jgi:hypothetical protein
MRKLFFLFSLVFAMLFMANSSFAATWTAGVHEFFFHVNDSDHNFGKWTLITVVDPNSVITPNDSYKPGSDPQSMVLCLASGWSLYVPPSWVQNTGTISYLAYQCKDKYCKEFKGLTYGASSTPYVNNDVFTVSKNYSGYYANPQEAAIYLDPTYGDSCTPHMSNLNAENTHYPFQVRKIN